MITPNAQQFAEVARDLAGEDNVLGAAQRVLDWAMDLTDADDFGLLLRAAEGWRAATSSSDVAANADELQLALGEGPAVDAAQTRSTVVASDMAADTRWPEWSPRAAAMGIGSAVAACLSTERRMLGALVVYRADPARTEQHQVDMVTLLAGHAAVVLDGLRHEAGVHDEAAVRNVIGQGQGLLMERYALDSRRALEVMRRFAGDTDMSLREVAAQLIGGRTLPVSTVADLRAGDQA